MPLITWDKTLSVNVKEIDLQHQKLIELMNQLHEVMKQGKGREVTGDVIAELVSYTQTHFKTEEDYFDKFNYPLALMHKLEHKRFVQKALEFQERFNKQENALTVDIMGFLKDWLIKHIKGTDMRYTKCFNEHGLS